MIEIKSKGDYKNTLNFFTKMKRGDIFRDLDRYGRMGVDLLAKATPVRTGLTANSWGYRVVKGHYYPRVEWYNTNHENGVVIAILIQYGHGTRNGGYVQGRDYVNPAIRPIFDMIADDVWKKVRG